MLKPQRPGVYRESRSLEVVIAMGHGGYLLHMDEPKLPDCHWVLIPPKEARREDMTKDPATFDPVADKLVEVLLARGAIQAYVANTYRLIHSFKVTRDSMGMDFNCLACGMHSRNPNDSLKLYCGHCHVHHQDVFPDQEIPQWLKLAQRRASA